MTGCGKAFIFGLGDKLVCGESRISGQTVFCSSCQATKEKRSLDVIGAKLRGKQKEEFGIQDYSKRLVEMHVPDEERAFRLIGYEVAENEWRGRIQKALEEIKIHHVDVMSLQLGKDKGMYQPYDCIAVFLKKDVEVALLGQETDSAKASEQVVRRQDKFRGLNSTDRQESKQESKDSCSVPETPKEKGISKRTLELVGDGGLL